jgi:hypothetical protein
MTSDDATGRVARLCLLKHTKTGKSIQQNITNDHKIYEMAIKYSKRKFQHFPLYVRPSKINRNWDFWCKNRPSSNTGQQQDFLRLTKNTST